MDHFRKGMRVTVVSPDESSLKGYVGTVTRLRIADEGAWIRMDELLPEGLANFPLGDPRHRDYTLYPDECEEI